MPKKRWSLLLLEWEGNAGRTGTEGRADGVFGKSKGSNVVTPKGETDDTQGSWLLVLVVWLVPCFYIDDGSVQIHAPQISCHLTVSPNDAKHLVAFTAHPSWQTKAQSVEKESHVTC
jgi:hypothetical protein